MSRVTVPLLDIGLQNNPLREEIRAAIDRVLESQRFILGPEVDALEHEVALYCGAKHGVGVSSGTDALLMALMALGIKRGDDVVVPAFTFFATAGVVARLGARPVFVDIDPDSFNMDPDSLERCWTPATRAVIPVHLFGQMADMKRILEIAEKRNAAVIEDAAQAIGAERSGQRAGSVGKVSAFSFYPTKNLGGVGDGGMLTTNDPALAEHLRSLRDHGFEKRYFNRSVGGNFRLDGIQGAVLRVKLPYLDRWTERRRENAAAYRQLFSESGLMSTGQVRLPVELPGVRHIYNQFVIRVQRRDELMAFLRSERIGCEVYYPVPLHLQECFHDLGGRPGDFPVSEAAAREVLALPIFPELTPEQLEAVVQAVRKFFAAPVSSV